ncbi:MAG: hypothetical protein IJ410_08290 [Oscillospiraceae bacterium]|nr:hypothetical protein [Oscillospiraceae bacterium]
MKNNKPLIRTLRLFAVAAAFIISMFFTGNPLTCLKTSVAVSDYLIENYGDDYKISSFRYHRFGHEKIYSFDVEKENSLDEKFYIYSYPDGEGIRDTYQRMVADGTKTYFRIGAEYKLKVSPLLEKMEGLHIHDAEFSAMPRELLIPDKIYDIDEISAEYGTLVLSFEEETGGLAEFADKLLEIKAFCDENGIKFAYIDLDGVKNNQYAGGISVDGFPYKEITEDNLENRIATADDARQYYQKWQDGMHLLRNRYVSVGTAAESAVMDKYIHIEYMDYDFLQTPRAKEYFSVNGYEPADYGVDIDEVITDREYTRQEISDFAQRAGVVKATAYITDAMTQEKVDIIASDIMALIKDSGIPHRHIKIVWKADKTEYKYWQ